MIVVTKLNGKRFVLNAEQIRFVETTPDTMVTLLNGDKVIVTESLEDVIERVIEYQRQIRLPVS